jgi:DNA-binding NarL/FixJ family response regulator
MTLSAIRVVLADDHAVVRAGVTAVLGAAPDITVIGQAADGQTALELARTLEPDVVVMDLSMPDMDGLAATQAIVALPNAPRVLVLTMHDEAEYLKPLLAAGATGYLVKNVADRDLVEAVRAVAKGDVYVGPTAARVLVQEFQRQEVRRDDEDRYAKLTQRERDVLRLIAHGYSAPEVGEQLFISPKTVDTYKQRIQEKLGFTHRAEYVRFALKLGLLAEG